MPRKPARPSAIPPTNVPSPPIPAPKPCAPIARPNLAKASPIAITLSVSTSASDNVSIPSAMPSAEFLNAIAPT